MKRLLLLTLLSGFLLSLISCSGENKVVSNSIIQKRKHTKGFYLDFVSKKRKADTKLIVAKETVPNHSDIILPIKPLEVKEPAYFLQTDAHKDLAEMQNRQIEPRMETRTSTEAFSKQTELAQVTSVFIENSSKSELHSYSEAEDANIPFKASLTFFCGILGWFFLVAAVLVPIILSQTWLIGLIIWGFSMILELIAFFVGQNIEGAVKAGDIGFDLSKYYWWFLGTMLTISLSSLIFVF